MMYPRLIKEKMIDALQESLVIMLVGLIFSTFERSERHTGINTDENHQREMPCITNHL